jgi:hypothetical protein
MVPLTDATIGFVSGGVMHMRDVPTLIINSEMAEWLAPPDDDAQVFTEQAAAAVAAAGEGAAIG